MLPCPLHSPPDPAVSGTQRGIVTRDGGQIKADKQAKDAPAAKASERRQAEPVRPELAQPQRPGE